MKTFADLKVGDKFDLDEVNAARVFPTIKGKPPYSVYKHRINSNY